MFLLPACAIDAELVDLAVRLPTTNEIVVFDDLDKTAGETKEGVV